jgi:hypothetical protein
MSGGPDLRDVTLCCIDCAQPALAVRALGLSAAQARFGAVLLLTDADLAAPGLTVRRIGRLRDGVAYSHFVLKDLVAHVATPFVLVVQWDGWVLDGARWEEGFRAFDYIGAPWPWHPAWRQVGNGGFSLRSRRLLEVVAEGGFVPGHPEDEMIGGVWRAALEARGIRFADAAAARRFSVERDRSAAPSFGFHGVFNFWRTVPAAELEGLLAAVPAGGLLPDHGAQLLMAYAARGRREEAAVVLRRLEALAGAAAVAQRLGRFRGTDGRAMDVAALRRSLLGGQDTRQ